MTVSTGLDHPLGDDTTEVQFWRRSYPARPEQARELRRFLACLLADFPNLDDVISAAAEMYDNGIQHTLSKQPGGVIRVEVRRWPSHCVTVALTDQGGPNEPRPREADENDEHGRGLAILNATTTYWGWHGDMRGRTVTAIFLA